jgi:hypothetical protein
MTGNTTCFKFVSVPLKWLGMGDFKVEILPGLKVLILTYTAVHLNCSHELFKVYHNVIASHVQTKV